MEVVVKFLGERKRLKLPENSNVRQALRAAGINPETVIVKKRKAIVTEDSRLKNGDLIEPLKVISGG